MQSCRVVHRTVSPTRMAIGQVVLTVLADKLGFLSSSRTREWVARRLPPEGRLAPSARSGSASSYSEEPPAISAETISLATPLYGRLSRFVG